MNSDKIFQIVDTISPDRIELGKEAEYFKMIDSALDVGVAILDENMIYRYMGVGMMEQLGLPAGTLKVGDHLSDCHAAMVEYKVLAKDVIEDARISTEKNISGGIEKDADFIHKFSNGRRIQLVRKKLSNGYLISMAFDVTALAEKDEFLEESLRLGKAGYWIYDFATKTYTLSQTLKDYFGLESVKKIRENGIIQIIHKDDRSKFTEALKNLGKKDDMFDVTCRSNTGDGEERFSRATGKIHRDENNKPVYIRAFVKDVSQERYQSMALERAKDEAIAASHAKSEFLANMSHEIRTPMNGVLGMAELLMNTNIDDRQKEFVNVINDSASALLTIINDILDFSKIEAGALELDPTAFNLRDVIADVVALLLPKVKEKNLEVIVNYPPTLPSGFFADSGRLRQVITNLVSNAVKFTENGQIIIDVAVATSSRSSEKNMVTVKISDTGIGIEPHKISDIFNKFTQADGSTTRNYGGTGLGLSISKKIIELMTGRMNVTSEFGQGSTFGFTVPLTPDESNIAPAFDTAVLSKKRVLIVDDIAINRDLLAEQTKAWGMIPSCCENGIDALVEMRSALAAGTPYDLILLDYLMPGMNGREIATMITANSTLGNPPIIILSSCDQPNSSEEFSQIGVLSFLMKPVRETRLVKTITSVLSAPAMVLPTLPDLGTDKPAEELKFVPPPSAPIPKIDVLVAEDFKLNQDVVRLMLADSVFSPTFADNGLEAVTQFKANPDKFALVLMDVSMPVMDGYEATHQINNYNESEGRNHTPIIALTGHALKYDRENCLDAGMDDYLVKPVQQSKLLEMMERYYKQTQETVQHVA